MQESSIQRLTEQQLSKHDSEVPNRLKKYVRCERRHQFVLDMDETMRYVDDEMLKYSTVDELVREYMLVAEQVRQKWPTRVCDVCGYYHSLVNDHFLRPIRSDLLVFPDVFAALYLCDCSKYLNSRDDLEDMEEDMYLAFNQHRSRFKFIDAYPVQKACDFPCMVVSKGDTTFVIVRSNDVLESVLSVAYSQPEVTTESFGTIHKLPHDAYKILLEGLDVPESDVVFCGIGVAGTIAALLAVEFALRTDIRPRVYTFNAPRAGSQEFEDLLDTKTTAVSCRTVDNPMYLVGQAGPKAALSGGASVTRTGGTAYLMGEHGVTVESNGHPMDHSGSIGLLLATFFYHRQCFTVEDCSHGITNARPV